MKMLDVHRHFFFGKADLEDLLHELEIDGIEQTVLFGYHGMKFFGKPHLQDQEILSFSKKYPDKILPFFCDFDLYASEAADYIKQCAEKGFCGMGEILLGHTPSYRNSFGGCRYCDMACIKAFQTAGECGIPVLVHVDPMFMDDFLAAVGKCPHTNFILAHLGYDFTGEYGGNPRKSQEVEGWLAGFSNLYMDISSWRISPAYLMEQSWQSVMEAFSERILLGFDMSENYLVERIWIPAYRMVIQGLSEKAKRNICGEAFQNLFPHSGP